MKTLTVKQPFAHLICLGIKDVENRSKPTKYRGRILIHSSKTIHHSFREMSSMFTYEQWGLLPDKVQTKCAAGLFDTSSIIGSVEIVDCIRESKSLWALNGYYHWILKDPVLFSYPIPNVKGKLSFWEYPLIHLSS